MTVTPRAVHILMIVTQCISLVSLLLWALIAPATFGAFKGLAPERYFMTLLLVIAIWIYPFAAVLLSLSSWTHLRKGNLKAACILTSAPLVVFIPFVFYGLTVAK